MNQLLPTPHRQALDQARSKMDVIGGWRRDARRWALVVLGCVALLAVAPVAAAQASGTIKGTVTEAAGSHAGIVGVEVSALSSTTHEFVSSVDTVTGGGYELTGLTSGSYKVEFIPAFESKFVGQFFDNKSSFAAAETVTLAEGETKAGIDAQLGEGGTISGTVTGAGVPLGSVGVDVFPTEESEFFFGTSTTTEAGTGKYTLVGLPQGSYTVEFFPEAGLNFVPQFYNEKSTFSKADPVKINAEGEPKTEVNANLQVGGEISGTVTDAATHKPLANVFVYAGNMGGFESFGGFAETNANGEYTIPGLASGSYNLEFEFFSETPGAPGYISQTDNGVGVTQGSVTGGINVALAPNAPTNTVAPVASGTPAVGQTLSCSTGTWTGIPTLKYGYQWLHDGAAIAGASGNTYVVQSADQGHGLACQVTATNAAGHSVATSNTLAVPPPPPPPVPVIELSTSKIVVSGGSARVPIACAAANCTGTIELTEQIVVKHRKGKKTIKKKKTVVLGKGSYSLVAGKSATIAIRLTAAGKSALAKAKHHKLSAKASATVSGGKTVARAIVLSQIAPKKHKPKHK
jgi:hypothetical protein